MIAENIVKLYRRSGETGGYPCGYRLPEPPASGARLALSSA